MIVLVILCTVLSLVYGQALPCLPNGHDLNVILDRAFNRLDANADGLITVTEFEAIIRNDDKNSDGNVTLEEFKTAFGYHEIYEPMFHHFDHNADGVLETSDIIQEFLASDTSDDDQVDMKEFESFYHGVLNHIFGNNHCHGHGQPGGK